MAMTTSLIESAMATNAAAGDTESQAVANARLAQAIIDTVKTLTLTYSTGLVSASPGSPVTGTMATVVVS